MPSPSQLLPPPDGDVSRGPQILAVSIVTTTLALIFVAARLYVRAAIIHGVGSDDYFMLGAAAFSVITMAFEILSVSSGSGRHMYYLSPEDVTDAYKWSQLGTIPGLLALLFSRVSVCLFLLRIVDRVRTYRIFLWTVIALNVATTTMVTILTLVHCRPFQKLWEPEIEGACFPPRVRSVTTMVQAVVNIATDWLVALFPILLLSRLKMARRTKYGVGAIMCLGFFVGIAALVKMLQLHELVSDNDVTWDSVDLVCWGLIELNLGIVVISVPAIRPLFSHFFNLGGGNSDSKPNRTNTPPYGYDMGDTTGRKGPHRFPAATASIAPKKSRAGDIDSESSLVGDSQDNGIMGNISISLDSQREYALGQRQDLENATSWVRI